MSELPRSPWRRRLLIAGGALGGAFALGVWQFYRPRDRQRIPAGLKAGENEAVFNAWVRIGTDGRIVVQVPRQEMGQGITTALPMLVAEELDADPASVAFEQAPVDAVYANATMFGDGVPFRPDDHGWIAELMRRTQFQFGAWLGIQATGGSTGVRDGWIPMRHAGAAARVMLLEAGATRLGVAAAECTVVRGVVTHPASGRHATFGELALDAARSRAPDRVTLKPPAAFTVLGTSPRRLDIPAKVDGSALFGMDVRVPGMLFGAIAQCPVFGGRLRSHDDSNARAMPGVKAIVSLDATSTSAAAVVVVAAHYWQARSALSKVAIEWDDGPNAGHDTSTQRTRYESLLRDGSARTYDEAGDVENALAAPPRLLDAVYHAPYLAHAAMEPLNCTAVVRRNGTAEVWVGSQAPTLVRRMAAQAAGLETDGITVHTPYLGGGFGRRAEMDVVVQAVSVARQVPDTPVQLIWTREEDTGHDMYRPMAAARMRAVVDSAGNLAAWVARTVGQSCTGGIVARLLPAVASDAMKDRTTTEGLFDLPYAIPNRRVERVLTHEPVPVGFWRSVGHSQNAFFAESFIDECAIAAQRDPLEFRRALLAHSPRHLAVLDRAATAAGWGTALPPGTARGIALAESFHAIVAQVAEVSIEDGAVRVGRVFCAVDCGFAIHPDTVVAQMESAIVFGLSAALHGEITVEKGRVVQTNFTDYRVLTLATSPRIEVHIVNSGIEHPGGAGEPGTPPVAPAVCNAIFALTGKRVRALPVRL